MSFLGIRFKCPDVNYNTEAGPLKRIGAQWTSGVKSAEDCSTLCQRRSDCNYWTWHHDKAGGWSYKCVTMKDAGTRVKNTKCVSGEKSCKGKFFHTE